MNMLHGTNLFTVVILRYHLLESFAMFGTKNADNNYVFNLLHRIDIREVITWGWSLFIYLVVVLISGEYRLILDHIHHACHYGRVSIASQVFLHLLPDHHDDQLDSGVYCIPGQLSDTHLRSGQPYICADSHSYDGMIMNNARWQW